MYNTSLYILWSNYSVWGNGLLSL